MWDLVHLDISNLVGLENEVLVVWQCSNSNRFARPARPGFATWGREEGRGRERARDGEKGRGREPNMFRCEDIKGIELGRECVNNSYRV